MSGDKYAKNPSYLGNNPLYSQSHMREKEYMHGYEFLYQYCEMAIRCKFIKYLKLFFSTPVYFKENLNARL